MDADSKSNFLSVGRVIEQELQRKIEDFRVLGLPSYVPRQTKVHLVDRMVSTVIGARRSGKSFRVLQLADELIRQGSIASLDHVCPVDFDNPILSGMSAQDLSLIQSTYLKSTPGCGLKTPVLFILDEIHRISAWEDYVIDLSRNPHWKVIVTGASAKLLKEDIATARYFGTKQNLVATLNQEQRFTRDGITVHALPAWRWLLS